MDVNKPGWRKCGDCGRRSLRPSDGECIFAPLHRSNRGVPFRKHGTYRERKSMSHRCPRCREASRGTGCFQSACICSCHRELALQNMGLDPGLLGAIKMKAPLAKTHFGAHPFKPRLADHPH